MRGEVGNTGEIGVQHLIDIVPRYHFDIVGFGV